MSRNRWPSIWLVLQKSFSRHFDVPVTCKALELLFWTSFQQLESLVTHTQKLGAQLAPPAFKGLRLACCVAHVPNLRLMVFSLMLVIRITEQSGVPSPRKCRTSSNSHAVNLVVPGARSANCRSQLESAAKPHSRIHSTSQNWF